MYSSHVKVINIRVLAHYCVFVILCMCAGLLSNILSMKKVISVVIGILVLAPSLALAAPTGWKAPADCHVPPDNGIYDDFNHLTGCIDSVVWAQSAVVSVGDQSKLRQFIFPSSTTKVGSDGVTYTCPWFFGFIDCILPPQAR